MSTATALGSVLVGFNGRPIVVTATADQASRGGLEIVGLPDAAAREARIRVRSALASDPRTAPATDGLKVRVSVADVPIGVSTASLDLAIAVAVLRAAGVPVHVGKAEDVVVFIGELALDGRIRPVRGALRHVGATDLGVIVVVPRANAWEVGLHAFGNAYAIEKLGDACDGAILRADRVVPSSLAPFSPLGVHDLPASSRVALEACSVARRALLVGPPGSNKTLIARRLSMTEAIQGLEAFEVAQIHGVAGLISEAPLSRQRPFRAPHHTCSTAALVGGGVTLRPGEVSLAHRGTLFLGELPEFRRESISSLGSVLRARSSSYDRVCSSHGRVSAGDPNASFPAEPRFVIAAANPCPCGYGERPRCTCRREVREAYDGRLETLRKELGLQRIDVPAVTNEELLMGGPS